MKILDKTEIHLLWISSWRKSTSMSEGEQVDPITQIQSKFPTRDQDYYAILGLDRDAADRQILTSFKKLSLKYHPDRNPDDENAQIAYDLVNEAYQVLVDPEKRAKYDQDLHAKKIQSTIDSHEAASDRPLSINSKMKAIGAAMSRFSTVSGIFSHQDLVDIAQKIAV